MPTYNVQIKHAGKTHSLPLSTDAPPTVFKESIYQVTGVPVERMKVMIKGSILKDESDWSKLSIKEGTSIMVIGAAGELPKPPSKPVVFLEDMDESELAEALALPVGLTNLGNTCYMNATLQALRTIPELQRSLVLYPSAATPTSREGNHELTSALGSLYAGMRITTAPFTPLGFLGVLRQAVPQFGERSRSGKAGISGYAQQDAEECWVQIMNNLRGLPAATEASESTTSQRRLFIEHFMMGEMRREMMCDEAPEEPPTVSTEKILKIECNIGKETNHMHTGIMDALNQKIEKNSPSLGRQAIYTQSSRLSRIPVNLTVHMVRFAWKREINKKAKIMRKVKFPLEFDVVDLCTDDLKAKIAPVNTRLKEIERDRAERRKVRKRTKAAKSVDSGNGASPPEDVTMADVGGPSSPVLVQSAVPAGHDPPFSAGEPVAGDSTVEKEKAPATEGGELEPESVYRARELAELEALVPADLKSDSGCSVTGLYELVGIVTHKGAAADSGHYIGFAKKSALHPVKVGGEAPEPSGTGVTGIALEEDDEDWYKFDDDKVSVFPKDKLSTLEGGGELS